MTVLKLRICSVIFILSDSLVVDESRLSKYFTYFMCKVLGTQAWRANRSKYRVSPALLLFCVLSIKSYPPVSRQYAGAPSCWKIMVLRIIWKLWNWKMAINMFTRILVHSSVFKELGSDYLSFGDCLAEHDRCSFVLHCMCTIQTFRAPCSEVLLIYSSWEGNILSWEKIIRS